MSEANPRAVIGDNAAPFEVIGMEIDDLFDEAVNFLDGAAIENEGQAEALASLRDRLRATLRAADEQRKAEKKPHDDAAKAVQAKWSPLIDKADSAKATCENALTIWLQEQEAIKRATAQAARDEAERLRREADEARANAGDTNLAARMEATARMEAAQAAERHAGRLGKAKAQVAGASRAAGLRGYWTPTLTNPAAALRHYRERQPEELKAWLLDQARRDVRAGARSIPGFSITEDKRA